MNHFFRIELPVRIAPDAPPFWISGERRTFIGWLFARDSQDAASRLAAIAAQMPFEIDGEIVRGINMDEPCEADDDQLRRCADQARRDGFYCALLPRLSRVDDANIVAFRPPPAPRTAA